ncbi:MAG TPA: ATP-binding protein [Candidatus Paceibacterota bacterium]|nr:ATP-binding protein [Candidatus Paceibacterota bacterium]
MNALSTGFPYKAVRAFYESCIRPLSQDEDARRKELIFNTVASSLFIVLCLLELSIAYSDVVGADKGGFHSLGFLPFVLFFGSLLFLSRKGHTDLATYLFLGLYFLASTWGVYAWGIAVPLCLLSYGAIIVMAGMLLGTRAGFIATTTAIGTLVTLGYLETHGIVESDITWRFTQLEFKDAVEDSFIFAMIAVVSWLSNREIESSLRRARRSEQELKAERDLLEVKVEERTRQLKAVELEKVAQLYRFVEFGRLASGIFHDLLNPLSAVAMSVEQLEKGREDDGTSPSASVKECVDRALRASKRMESFMQTARKQLDSADRLQDFSVSRELRDAVDLLSHKSRVKGVEIDLSAASDVSLYGNPVKLFQVAVNLISNAIDSYDGLAARPDRRVTVDLRQSGGFARIDVADSGSGIPPEIRSAIFEPFFSTKDARTRTDSGLGLGLSTTKEHVEKDFGGTIRLETSPGKGSVFTVIIPLNGHDKREGRKDRPIDRGGS